LDGVELRDNIDKIRIKNFNSIKNDFSGENYKKLKKLVK
jgi:hypothetical protein